MTKKNIFIVIAIIGLVILAACNGNITTPDKTNPSKTIQNGMDVGNDKKYTELFAKDSILDISITIDPAYLESMYQSQETSDYYSATIKIGKEEIKNSGLRITGNTDLDGGDESSNRFSYKIKFDKFVPKQRLYGLDELVLSNVSRDPSYMREYLMCEAFAKVGLPAPIATFASITINGNDIGFYVAIEAIDDSFLKRAYGENKGNLYKSNLNATLEDLNSLTIFDQKNGKDESKLDLQTLIESLNNMPLGEKGDIEKILDVDSVLKYIAVNTILGNYDSYIGSSSDNFFLYSSNSKLSMIPWDFNLAFGARKKDNGISVSVPIDSPVYRCEITQRPLVLKILSVPEYYTKYLGYINTSKEFLSNLENRINEIDKVIANKVQNDPSAFYSYEDYQSNIGKSEGSSGVISITEYSRLRLESIS